MGAASPFSFVISMFLLLALIIVVVWAVRTRKKLPAILAAVLGLAIIVLYLT